MSESNGSSNGLTETEDKIIRILADEERHSRYQLADCLPDELSTINALQRHISAIRKKLPDGHYVICEQYQGGIYYRYLRSHLVKG
jgi:DNA-binding winged helix-turn-helix (wHTH) protein